MKTVNVNHIETSKGVEFMEKQIADNIAYWEKAKAQQLSRVEKICLAQGSKPAQLFGKLLPKWEKRKQRTLAKA